MYRSQALQAALLERGLDAILVTHGPNRRYLSGFTGSAGALLVCAEATILFTDFRYHIQADRESPGWQIRNMGADAPLPGQLAAAAAEFGLRRIGFEATHTSVASHGQLVAALPGVELVAADGIVEPLRAIKDEPELATLRQAIAITDAAITAVLPALRPEHSERQAAWMLEVALRERGAEAVSFPTIVAAGPNAALPHARPGDDLLGEGRPIVIDMGGRLNGYHADLTRTVVLGEPDGRFWQVYDAVLAAQRRAIANIRSGMAGGDADALARDLLAEHGYAELFGHSLGHGVGLEIHEGPSLRRANTQPLRPGSVFSVEPGVYIEGWGGVRIEDLVLLREDGCEVLSAAPKLRA